MRRTARTLATIVIIAGALIPAIAQMETTTITVRLFNRSRVAASTLIEGEKQATELLLRAGIQVNWLNCPHGTPECIEQPSPRNLILTVLKQGSAMGSKDVLGLAVQDARGSGTYCYVFENKLNDISGQLHIPITRLLGYAISHELGHLLKGSHSHSRTGIMSGLWSRQELEQVARGALSFTTQDAVVMHTRLASLTGDEATLRAKR